MRYPPPPPVVLLSLDCGKCARSTRYPRYCCPPSSQCRILLCLERLSSSPLLILSFALVPDLFLTFKDVFVTHIIAVAKKSSSAKAYFLYSTLHSTLLSSSPCLFPSRFTWCLCFLVSFCPELILIDLATDHQQAD